MGLIRVRKFQLTDGHLFVAPEGLKDEFKNVCRMIAEGMQVLGLSNIVSYRFSKRDPQNKEKYYPDDALWKKAEKTMKEALDELGFNYTEAEDEAAFYGPKLDVQAKNVNGKEDTLFTAQIDFLLPEKFNIEYIDQHGEKKRPVMIHRSTIGCLERVFGFLIEHYAGAFPTWLSPVQVELMNVNDRNLSFMKTIEQQMKEKDIRVEIDDRSETIAKKVRDAQMQHIPYMITIGDKEVEKKTLAIRTREGKVEFGVKIDEFIAKLTREIKERK